MSLPFVWRHVDAVGKVITLRHHFDLLWAVKHHIGPWLEQEILQKLEEIIGEVVIIGGKEAFRSNSNDIIYTERKNNRLNVGFLNPEMTYLQM